MELSSQRCRVATDHTGAGELAALDLRDTPLLHESYDEAMDECRIAVQVTNSRFGPLFGDRGSFTCSWNPVGPEGVPGALLPLREESRR